jgi:hypothetical protein
MEEWVTFHGSATEGISEFELQPTSQAGKAPIPKDGIAFTHGNIALKSGAKLTFVEPPELAENIAGYVQHHNCSETYSFGLVEVCADDGRVLGPCRHLHIKG